MSQKFRFLCGNFRNENIIYAVKFSKHRWHYFDDIHRNITEHDSLPSGLGETIATFKKVRSVEIELDEGDVKRYYDDGKFIFKNTELKTFKKPTSTQKKETRKLKFDSLEMNPLLFLEKYEECDDVKTDREKLWKIRDFVNLEDRGMYGQESKGYCSEKVKK